MADPPDSVTGPPPGDPRADDLLVDDPGPATPPVVVAVVVTHDPGPGLEDTLASLGAQDYPGLRVLVVDAGSGSDPTDRVLAVVPEARVRRSRADGFAEAANEALAVAEQAAFLCFCHDDVRLEPDAIRILVEEAYRSNAAVCGPKLVEHDRPEVLLEVGRSIDRFGGAHTGIEPGEIDQEQHDAVRDVFYVPSATMLVRADLFRTLGGFDAEAFPGSEDLDLCWRARLAGARVMAVPDARVGHREAGNVRAVGDPAEVRARARRRVRTAFTCYSTGSLVWIVPLGLVVSTLEVLAFLFSRRRTEALAEARAWWWCLGHPGRIRRARRRAQQLRTVHDLDLWELQIGWVARLRSFLTHHHADERVESIGDRVRLWGDRTADALRHPGTLAVAAFLVVLVIGSRAVITDGVPAVGTLVPWVGVGSALDAFTSAWRDTGLGAPVPASGALAVVAGLTTATLGHPALAQTLAVLGAFVVGPLGVARLLRRLAATRGPAVAGAVLYGVSPVVRNAFAGGRLGAIVLYATAPFLVLAFVRASGFAGPTAGDRRGRALLGLAALAAVTVAFAPAAALFLVLVAVAALLGSLCTGRDVGAAVRGLGVAVAGTVGALVLLFPWSLSARDLVDDPAAFGVVLRVPDLDLGTVLRFATGPAGAGVASLGVYATALFALAVARGPRLAWVARAWFLVAVGVAAAFVPSRVWPDAAVPPPEGALVAAALGLAVAAGLGVGAFVEELRRARFGWRQLAAVVAAGGVALASLGFVADAADGRWHAARSGWNDPLAFTTDRPPAGAFRILWLGDAAVLPTDPFPVRDGVAYALTVDGAGDVRSVPRAPAAAADAVLADAVELALDGRTNRLGRIVAPMGVRYVAAPVRNGPAGPERRAVPGLRSRLADQLDLAELGTERGLVLYENTAWFAGRGVVAAADADAVPTGDRAAIPASLGTDLAGAVTPLGTGPAGPGRVVAAEAFASAWTATVADRPLRHAESFGWANSWVLPRRGEVVLRYDDQWPTRLMIAGQAVLWLVVAVVGWTGRRRRVPVARPRLGRAERREQADERRRARDAMRDRRRRDDLDDDFWAQA